MCKGTNLNVLPAKYIKNFSNVAKIATKCYNDKLIVLIDED